MVKAILNKLVVATTLTVPLLSLAAPKALANEYYGAIARSPMTGSHGYAYDYATRDAAETRALRECESYSGAGDCQVLVWFANACGALAEGSNGAAGTGWGADVSTAEYYAIETCKDYGGTYCQVTRWVCTTR
jgi:serine/threonine-protein kinase